MESWIRWVSRNLIPTETEGQLMVRTTVNLQLQGKTELKGIRFGEDYTYIDQLSTDNQNCCFRRTDLKVHWTYGLIDTSALTKT
jgi:hypothetical protein